MTSFAKEILVDFISMLYPRYCFACKEGLVKGENMVCSNCMLEIPRTYFHLYNQNALFRRLNGRIPLQSAFAFFFFRKGGKVQHLLHALKYDRHPEIGEALGEVYGEELKKVELNQKFDCIVPVPLHPVRLRTRGYNQSEEFGRGLSKSLNIPLLSDALVRTVKTDSQTRKSKLNRWRNVTEVFQLQEPEQIYNKRVLLVDDVITTGATIEACAQELVTSSTTSVSIASIAYAEDGR
jgi:ComF family protein